MKRYTLSVLLMSPALTWAQGLLNNGASIVFSGGGQVYIDGSTGHYTSQSGGSITPSATSSVTLLGNWINNAANVGFTADGGGVVLAGASQSIGGSNSTKFNNLTLSGSGTKTLLLNTTVGGQSVYNGVLALGALPLDLNSNRLDVTNSAAGAITSSTGYIISETNVAVNPSLVRWYTRTSTGSHVYPFGVSGTQIPFTFNITSAMGASDYVEVSTRATSNASNTPWAGASNVGAVTHMYSPIIGADGSVQVVIDRWWNITSSSAVTANVTFSYRGSENTLTSPYQTGQLGAQHWNGTAWEPPVGSAAAVTSGVGSVTANGLNTFSPWVLSSLLAPLPVELTSFEATCMSNDVFITWSTASEKNNLLFTIERSTDGIHYTGIATVNGSGNSGSTMHYNYTDAGSNTDEVLYYRISQTDNTGTGKVLKTISISGCGETRDQVHVYNTTDGSVYMQAILNHDDDFTWTVYDMLGRRIISDDVHAVKGANTIKLPVGTLSQAWYMLHLQGSSEQVNQKVYIGQ